MISRHAHRIHRLCGNGKTRQGDGHSAGCRLKQCWLLAPLRDVTDKDTKGNAIRGNVLAVDTYNSSIYSEDKLIAAIGVQDLVIVETADTVMIAPKDQVQDFKLLVERLKQQKRPKADTHRKIYRPWGFFDEIDAGERHKTKRIMVRPGAKLSVQMHHHRADHWVVFKGTALVSRGNEQELVSES